MKKLLLGFAVAVALTFTVSTIAKADYFSIEGAWEDRVKDNDDAFKGTITYGTPVVENLDLDFSGELKVKEDDQKLSNRLEVGATGKYAFVYARGAVGLKFIEDDYYSYWSIEPGVALPFLDVWEVKAGVRFRDSFQSDKDDLSQTFRTKLSFNLTDRSTIHAGYDYTFSDFEEGSTYKVGYTLKF